MENVEIDTPSIALKEGIKLKDLMSDEGVTFEVNFDNYEEEDRYVKQDPNETFLNSRMECVGLGDEDNYIDGEPFNQIAAKMSDLLPGLINKRVLREGYGEAIPEDCVVYVDYNAYLEYNDEPFDSTYARKKPHKFQLGQGEVIPGLDFAVKSMKTNEKSQFLIQPEMAYGQLGCLDRIPPQAVVLFEIELKKYVNSGAAVAYEKLSEGEQKEFKEIYKYCCALCEKGNNLFRTHKSYRAAIYEYNIAVGKLEYTAVRDYEEQEQQQALLLRLYINLAVCYGKINEPKRVCVNCNKIFHMTKGTRLVIPPKVYYCNTKALLALNDLDTAERVLRRGATKYRDTPEFVNLFIILNKAKQEKFERDKLFAKALMQAPHYKNQESTNYSVSDDFKRVIRDLCEKLEGDPNMHQYNLPDDLSKNEVEFVKAEALTHNLTFKGDEAKSQNNFITKVSNIKID